MDTITKRLIALNIAATFLVFLFYVFGISMIVTMDECFKRRVVDNPIENITNINTGSCRRQYHIEKSDVRLSICYYHDDVLVDVRKFLNNNATIKGIGL